MRNVIEARLYRRLLGTCVLVLGTGLAGLASVANAQTVIDLTQVACQFVESENGRDREFVAKRAEDCKAINAGSGPGRLAEAKPLTLKPGKYVFRVTNKNVPYELGFWLREHDYSPANPLHRLRKISVSGGGLERGKTKDYVVELKPGEYVYSCPLNPTPDYKLIVAN
ncbi:MAG: hypothetical protein HY543_02710 [Deltaproteobacteria bacterium]|nr:hypothetical protein [Deltaproteobacteria bacterium]